MSLSQIARPGIAALALLACAGAVHAIPTFVNLGTLAGSTTSEGYAISADGSTVVGQTFNPAVGYRAFRWDSVNGMQDLGLMSPGTSAFGFGVSANGAAATGWGNVNSNASAAGNRAFRWDSNGFQDLGVVGNATQSRGLDMSDSGLAITGYLDTAVTNARAFRWDSVNGMQSLGTLPGSTVGSFGQGISGDASTVVGISDVGGASRAFRWDSVNGMVNLGILPNGSESFAYEVNGNGSVIAGSADSPTGPRAVRWVNGVIQDLGTLPGLFAGAQAFSVSGDGLTVGGTSNSQNNGQRAFIWTQSLGMTDLTNYLTGLGVNLGGGTLLSVESIDADGSCMTGWGDFNGDIRAWVVCNIPAPGAAPAFALAGLFAARRRRP